MFINGGESGVAALENASMIANPNDPLNNTIKFPDSKDSLIKSKSFPDIMNMYS